MKNIHILPTQNNKSKLATWCYEGSKTTKVGELGFRLNNTIGWSNCWQEKEMYITSDEEIKEGDWCFEMYNGESKAISLNFIDENNNKWYLRQINMNCSANDPECKKIVLTTNQDLIKDGVQAINDEFLEWFVTHPSCEEVKIKPSVLYRNGKYVYSDEIIIPKEEPCEYVKEVGCIKDICSCSKNPKKPPFKHECRVLSTEEVMEGRSSAYRFINFDKQETLEEAAKTYYEENIDQSNIPREHYEWEIQDLMVCFASKFQKQKSYNEEDMFDSWKASHTGGLSDESLRVHFNIWFEQFKKR